MDGRQELQARLGARHWHAHQHCMPCRALEKHRIRMRACPNCPIRCNACVAFTHITHAAMSVGYHAYRGNLISQELLGHLWPLANRHLEPSNGVHLPSMHVLTC